MAGPYGSYGPGMPAGMPAIPMSPSSRFGWRDAADLAIGIGTPLLSHKGARDQNQMQMAVAMAQMAFQERMSSTAWQRSVEDMRLAGLNPMLAFSQGPASSPGGAQPSIVDEISPAVSSALQVRMLRQQLKNMQAERRYTQQREATEFQETQLRFWKSLLAQKGYESQLRMINRAAEMMDLDVVSARNVAAVSGSKWGRLMEFLRRMPGAGALIPAATRKR